MRRSAVVSMLAGLAVAAGTASAAQPFQLLAPQWSGFAAAAPTATAARAWYYAGSLTTTVRQLSTCGADAGNVTVSVPALLILQPPLAPVAQGPDVPPPVGGERNPVDLVLAPRDAAAVVPGTVELATAQLFNATSPALILEYWRLRLAGSTLGGTLYDNHVSEAAAANLLTTEVELVPCQPQFGTYPTKLAVANGATLEGTLTADQARLRIRGNVVDGTRPFVADLGASRVR